MSHLTRREALKAAAAGVATLALPGIALAAQKEKGYTLPPLPYNFGALEPYIDARTMEIHHDKHHAAYVANANKLLSGHSKLLAMPVEKLLANIKEVPENIRQGVINNAGGHSNHSIFWTIMGKKGGEPKGSLGKAIAKTFGNFKKFKDELSTKANTQFGSGWAWLVLGKRGLQVVQRANQDSPYMVGLTPIMGIDVWEHAYYLKYQNLRPKYVEAWWNVVNWEACQERYDKALKG
jgi:Fe-Mn family superoxide dismutase